jgi:hypothetical protein
MIFVGLLRFVLTTELNKQEITFSPHGQVERFLKKFVSLPIQPMLHYFFDILKQWIVENYTSHVNRTENLRIVSNSNLLIWIKELVSYLSHFVYNETQRSCLYELFSIQHSMSSKKKSSIISLDIYSILIKLFFCHKSLSVVNVPIE